MSMPKNRLVFIAVMVLAVAGATTFIFLEEFIFISDGVGIENTETVNEIPIKTMTSKGGHYIGGDLPIWPKGSLDFPTQIQKGTPFDVTAHWTWVKYEIDENTGEPAIDENTGELEIYESASTSNNPELNMKDSGIYVDFISDVQLLNEEGFELSNTESQSLRFGYGNTFNQLKLPLIYDDSQEHQKTLIFQINDIYPDHNYITVHTGSNSELKLFYYEDQPNIITITTEFRTDETLCSTVDCMAKKYNEDKIAVEGGDVVYVKTPTGYKKINEIGQSTPPIIPDNILAELQYLGIDVETYIYSQMTPDELQEIRMMFNGKTFTDIPETAQYIQENNITSVIPYLLENGYTGGFIQEFISQYPELSTQSIPNPFFYSILPLAYGTTSDDIRVFGFFQLEDQNENRINAKGVKVCAFEYDENNISRYNKFNSLDICTTVRSNGYYYLTVPNIDMQDSSTRPDIVTKFIFENDDKFAIHDNSISTYPIFSDVDYYPNNISSNYAYMGIHLPSVTDHTNEDIVDRLSNVYNIFTSLNQSHEKILEIFNYDVSFVKVKWGGRLSS